MTEVLYEDLWNKPFDVNRPPTTVIFPDGIRVYYHPDLLVNLYDMRKAVKDDRDVVIILFGVPGSGKSVLAMQICKFFNPEFKIEHVAFDHKTLFQLGMNSPKMTAINYDESGESGATDMAVQKEGKKLLQYLRIVRQYNLFQTLCIPDFWELRKQIIMQRTDMVIEVYEEYNKDHIRWDPRSKVLLRGKYRVYDKSTAKVLYQWGKEFHDTPKGLKPSFYGDFSNTYVINEDEYRQKKDTAAKAYFYEHEKEEKYKQKLTVDREKDHYRMLCMLRNNPKMSDWIQKDYGLLFGKPESDASPYITRLNQKYGKELTVEVQIPILGD